MGRLWGTMRRSAKRYGRSARRSELSDVGQAVGVALLGAWLTGCLEPVQGNQAVVEATGGTEGATGGATMGADASGGATVASGGSSMTEDEWAAATAPRPGPHEIWTYDTCEDPHSGSTSVRVGQEYSVIPPLGYTSAPDFDAETNPVFDMHLTSYCMTSADCSEQPGGVCQGTMGTPYCQYADPPPRQPCRTDAECTSRPGGTCAAPFGMQDNILCYPTGACEDPGGSCIYAADPPCASDADCTEHANGTCIFPVTSAGCHYGTCLEDADCDEGLRCGCGDCVEADCTSDAACPTGEKCELSPPWCLGGYSFHCSTPNDTCVAGEPGCIYQYHSDGDYHWSAGKCAR